MATRLTWDELASPDSKYDAGKAIVGAAQGAYCQGYRTFPAFYNGSLFGDTPISPIARGLNDAICGNDPGGLPPAPEPIATGGQCEGVLYNVTSTTQFKINGGATQTTAGDLGNVFGAIQLSGINEDGTGWYVNFTSNITQSNPQGITAKAYMLLKPINNPNIFYEFVGYTITITRVDGQPDNCGNMKPDYRDVRPPGNGLGINLDATINFSPELSVPVDVNITNNVVNNNLEVNVDLGGIDVNFDLGGANVNFPNGNGFPGSGGATDLTPVLNQTTQILRDVDDIYDVVNDIFNNRLFFEDDTIIVAGCGDDGVTQVQVPVKVLRDENGNSNRTWIDILAAEIFQLRTQGIIDCAEEFDPVEISPPTIVETGDVLYTALQQPPTIGYLIEILAFDPAEIRTYKLGGDEDLEAGFGNVALSTSSFATIGDLTFMRTRRLFLPATSVTVPHYVRISLKPGITFRVVNLGYRKR